MRLCRVIGNLVASCKLPDHDGFKIMAVKPVDTEGNMNGDTILALDCAQAGVGDYVLLIQEGGSCTQVMKGVKKVTPKGDRLAVNTVIIGVVDYIEAFGKLKRFDHLSMLSNGQTLPKSEV
ncbi:MAG: EutN/CcmL family microcompartment protein [Candidatus Thermoplasmatota archaeon]|jgi:ethanolamine utilization protein EutN|nr:EutN/CcmL family microcompartment protein [Candidatus Thermoplasmatota archaeon]